MKSKIKSLLRRALTYWKLALEMSLIAFFIFHAWRHWDEIRAIIGRLSLVGLCCCMLPYILAYFIAGWSTSSLLVSFGEVRPYWQIMGIYFRRLPAKYLPGGIWHTVGRGGDFVRHGIPVQQVGRALLLEQMLAVWWSGFLGLLLASVVFDESVRRAALGLAFFWIAVPAIVLGYARRKRNYAQLVSAAVDPVVAVTYVAGWSCLATAFSIYLSLGGMTHGSLLQVAASYLVSWMVGALAFFAPQGMGVFEFSMGKAMGYSGPVAAGFLWFVGSYRLLVLATDLTAWATWSVCQQLPLGIRSKG